MKKIKQFIFTIIFLSYSVLCIGQLEFSKWYFGNNAGLDFTTPLPTVLTNGNLQSLEGCASVSDSFGNLLFYTNGITINNAQHAVMANGTGLAGDISSTQSSIIVQAPNSNSLFYVFTTAAGTQSTSIMAYSIVNMTLAAGLGSVTSKNIMLYNYTSEKQVAIRHCNGRDIWILSHAGSSNNFVAHLLTASGVSSNSIVSSVGLTFTTSTSGGIGFLGQLMVSPDGKKLGMAAYASSTTNVGQGFYLFDFDPSSGQVSNPQLLLNTNWAYGVEFSPDGTKLYGNVGFGIMPAYLYQWDICAPTTSAIIATQYSINIPTMSGSLQRAIDGKIYLTTTTQSLSVINFPNLSGAAMGFSNTSLSIAPKSGGFGLPNWVNSYSKPAISPFTSTIACNTLTFKVPAISTFSQGCSPVTYSPTGYLWEFGDPASGAANSSTLTNPSHIYAALGSYTVKLVLQGPCFNDTLFQSVSITTLGPNPAVTGPSLICKGDRYTYTVSGGTSYQWSTGATATAVALQPTQTTVYTCTATQNGCSVAKAFTVTVNPCLGAEEINERAFFNFFPNPVRDELMIELQAPFELSIYDLSGKLLIIELLQSGTNTLNTSGLSAGVYILKLKNEKQSHTAKLMKQE